MSSQAPSPAGAAAAFSQWPLLLHHPSQNGVYRLRHLGPGPLPQGVTVCLNLPQRLLHNYYFIAFFFVFILINVAKDFGVSYFSYLLAELGRSSSDVGLLNGLKAAAEVPPLCLAVVQRVLPGPQPAPQVEPQPVVSCLVL